MAKLVKEHRLALTEPENFQNKIHLIWETFKMKYERTRSRDTVLLDALLLELDRARNTVLIHPLQANTLSFILMLQSPMAR